ncbi:adapter molecule Crk isoform X2 [Harmonia axyridis]|uniref:adapter molecule Crk isoform X2 n=1 Tax=Harmonia axyridis TaxID=115357 RepID=UPI001E27758B|nr:adapter molecule Crk isoform X2 [Harmonia axyridis]
MAGSFDPEDKSSWYFGHMSRQEANDLLEAEREGGVFLVRDSSTCLGDFVLCVKEDSRVSHYIINKLQHDDRITYRIGDQDFPNLPELLAFYKLHYLDTTPLIRTASRRVEKVIAKYDFIGQDPDDLNFKRGDILTIVSKDEDQWWTAINSRGLKGSIPVPYVEKYVESQPPNDISRPSSGETSTQQQAEAAMKKNQIQRQLPAKARVKQGRVPNAYDQTQLKLEVGDIITVTQTNINGQWQGELNGKIGFFPFTHVEFLDSDNES